MNGDIGTSTPHSQQLRALLFTDLCDSLLLVERIGDIAAAELFQQHDRLVLALQQRWNGQLIDRSDGLFLLFERPVDALGFALDYQRDLQALGEHRELPLRARAGLHVGDVLTWENSAEAVKAGAKPVEVEGLAKPMAARLMQLARPGQILLSSVAESIVRRSSATLDIAEAGLVWRSFGRFRFRGVAQPMEVFGVRAPEMPAVGRPRSSSKAMRDVPLWRRPLAMVAEATAVIALVVGGWLILRPQPAIAFAERDWVMVGDLRNLTGEPVLDASVQQAFRISLEQSRYVNVISDLKARSALQQMRVQPEAALDSDVASEVAQRLGARLLLMPSISEVGGQLRLSVDVVDPRSRHTLAVASADGRGLQSVLTSTDKVVADLRGRLGEAMQRVQADSMPLPAATTSSLDALRAFAIGQKLYTRADYPGALGMYEQAVTLDPDFALAWMAQIRARFAQDDLAGAIHALDQVATLKQRLPARELLYLDAWESTLRDRGNAANAWRRLAELYPDYFAAQHNAALWLYADNRFDEAVQYAQRATNPRFELASVAQDLLGRVQVARGEIIEARRAFNRAIEGGRSASHRYLGAAEASQRNFADAERHLDTAGTSPHVVLERVSIAVDRGQWERALQLAQEGNQRFATTPGFDQHLMQLPLATVQWGAGHEQVAIVQLRKNIGAALHRIANAGPSDGNDDAVAALGLALLAERAGEPALARRVLDVISDRNDLIKQPPVGELLAVVNARIAAGRNDTTAGLALLRPWLTDAARFQTRVAAMDMYVKQGDNAAALQQAEILARSRGLAYAEVDCGYCMQAMNVIDSNRAGTLVRKLRLQTNPAAVLTAP